MKLQEALAELRKEEKRKFEQTVDLIINLRKINLKKDQLSFIFNLPHKIKNKKICAFLKEKSSLVKTITEPEFPHFKEKKELKKLTKEYDYFIASAPLMPKVATAFGKVLGPAGKMPSPQLGIIMQETENAIRETLNKISNSLKIRLKEASIKIPIGKESMKDEEIIQNIQAAYKSVENALPKQKESIRSVMVKLTMSKPLRVEVN